RLGFLGRGLACLCRRRNLLSRSVGSGGLLGRVLWRRAAGVVRLVVSHRAVPLALPALVPRRGGGLALARDRQCTREVAARAAEAGGVVEFAGRVREAQAEELFAQLANLFVELAALHV